MKKDEPITGSLRRHISKYGISRSPAQRYTEEMLHEFEKASGKRLSSWSTAEWKSLLETVLSTAFGAFESRIQADLASDRIKCNLRRAFQRGRSMGALKRSADAATRD